MWQLILGPVLGTLGGLVQKWFDGREKAAERAHELALMDKEIAAAERRAVVEQEMAREAAEAQAFGASYSFANDKLLPDGAKLSRAQTWLALLVDASTRLIRPLMTVWYQFALAGVFVWCALELRRVDAGVLSPAEMQTTMREVIYSVIGTAETVLLWWYAIRGTSRKGPR